MRYTLKGLGSNGSGQLGIGHTEDVSIPTSCIVDGVETNFPSKPDQIAAGGNHTLVHCADGSVYAAGVNNDGRCGIEPCSSPLLSFKRVTFEDDRRNVVENFKCVAATWEASFFVDIENRVFSCGKGTRGELGCGEGVSELSKPTRVYLRSGRDLASIMATDSCMSHVVVVLSDGDVWGWGGGRKGQLGRPVENVWSPRRISNNLQHTVGNISCGREFTFLVASQPGRFAEVLGSDKWSVQSSCLKSWPGMSQISACWGSVHILAVDGKVVSWGNNAHGQLAPEGLPPITKIKAGSEHVLAEVNDRGKNNVIAWGWGEHGNCGKPVAWNGEGKRGWNELGSGELIGAGCATSFLWQGTA